tara:strand:+ start:8 stop:2242 length:2235 start_codon:yes stop_codon:yes gene_type:complete
MSEERDLEKELKEARDQYEAENQEIYDEVTKGNEELRRKQEKEAEEEDTDEDTTTDKLESRGYKGGRESARQRQIRLRQKALADRDKEGSTVTRGPGQVFTGGKDTVEVPDRDMRTGQLIPNETELDQFGNPRLAASIATEIGLNLLLDIFSFAPPAQAVGSAWINYLAQKIRGEKDINKLEMTAASIASQIPLLGSFKGATKAGRFGKGVVQGSVTGAIEETGYSLGRGEEVNLPEAMLFGATTAGIFNARNAPDAFKAIKSKIETGSDALLNDIGVAMQKQSPLLAQGGGINLGTPKQSPKPGAGEGLNPEDIKKATDVSQDEFNKSLQPKSNIEGGTDLANIKKDVDATNQFNQKQYDLAKQFVFEDTQDFKISKADIRKMKTNARRKLKLKDVKKVQAKLNDPNITDEVVQRYYDDAVRSELGYTGTAGTIDFLNDMMDGPPGSLRKGFTSVDDFIANSRVGQSSIEDILDDMSFKLETPISKEKLQNLLDGTETYSFQTSRMRKKGEPPIVINDINSLQKAYFARLLALDDIAEFEKGHINAVDQIIERFLRGEKITPTASFKDNTNPEIARSIYKLVGNEEAFDAMVDINRDYIVKGLTDRELKFAQVFAGNRTRKANQDLDRVVNSVFGTEPDLESSLLAYVYPERSLNAMVDADMKVTFAKVFMKEFDELIQAVIDMGGKVENIGSATLENYRQRALRTTLESFPPDLSKDMGEMLTEYLKANKINVVDEFGEPKF